MKGKGCLIGIGILVVLSIIGNLLPESEKDIYQEAELNFFASNYEDALTKINEAIKIDSTNSKYYELRGKILRELQVTVHSEEDFEKTLFLTTTDLEKDVRIRNMIEWDLKHGEEDKARELLKKEIELYKEDSLKHIDVVEYAVRKYLSMGDTSEAINLYSILSDEYPKSGKFSNQSGILYTIQKKNKSAISEFKKAVKAEPRNDTYLYNLGITHFSVRNKKRAKSYFKQAMDSGNKDACKEYRELTARAKYYKRSRCCDGTTSSALGRGACSHHGGVCRLENVPYKEYTINCY